MKQPYGGVYEYSMREMITGDGLKLPGKEFQVFKSGEAAPDERIFRPARSKHFTVFMVQKGEHTIKINLVEHLLKKSSLIILPPNTVHEFGERDDHFDIIAVSFTTDYMSKANLHKKYIDVFTFFSSQMDPHVVLTDEEADNLNTILLLLKGKIDNYDNNPFKEEILHHGFNLFMFELAAILKKYRDTERLQLTRKESILIDFMKLLSLHFKEERSVQFYASRLFITPKHLTKTLKELTNKSCGEFIDEMVITEAKILLDDPAISIGNVADYLHFSDQFFFSKFFKNHTGLSPSEYKITM